jgi:hypothetical protein
MLTKLMASSLLPLSSSYWDGILAPLVVLAVVVMTLGFLFLVGRLGWAAREYGLACQERQRAHRKLIEMLHLQVQRLDNEALGVDQLWSASAALSAC